eukprot:gene3460-6886_t
MSLPTSGDSNPPNNPILQYYQDWSSRTPFVTRSSMIGMVTLYIGSFFFKADLYLGNQAYFTVMHLELYRLILSPLVGNSILTIIMVALFFPTMGTKIEYSMGSSAFLCLLGILTLATNLLFDALCVSLHYAGSPLSLFWNCSGFWTVLFGLIVIECLQMPDVPRRMMFIPIDIPSKYFPLVMYAIIMLLGGPQLDLAVAMGVGYIYSKGYMDRFNPSITFLERCEANGLLSSCVRNTGWVRPTGAVSGALWNQRDSEDEGKSDTGGGGGRSGPGVHSYGDSSNETKQEPKDHFPGSGRKLAVQQSSSGSSWMPSFGSSHGSSNDNSRETIAARRLAALQSSGAVPQPGSSSSSSSAAAAPRYGGVAGKQLDAPSITSSSGVPDPGAVAQLMVPPSPPPQSPRSPSSVNHPEMGYSHADASRALILAGGSLHGATQLLVT